MVPNSPAEKSGIILNDIIIKVGNKNIEKASDVISQISKNGINKTINILLKRRNKLFLVKVIPTDIINLQNVKISPTSLSISTHLEIQLPSFMSQLDMHSK